MRLKPEQLARHLEQGLAPVYLFAGDEPLQLMEAADAVRAAARTRGYTEREVFTADRSFDWSALTAASDSLSLFAERRILELRLPTGKPGTQGAKALEAYCLRLPEDTLLLVHAGKLEKSAANSKWVKSLEQAGVMIQVWPLSLAETAGWIARRLRSRGLVPDEPAVRLLAERVEGNLLAAAQEVEKLALLRGEGSLDADGVLEAVSDAARYTIYDLADAALAGDSARAVHVLNGLRGEGVDAVLILWALSREVRSLTDIAEQMEAGTPAAQAMKSVWAKRAPLVKKALARHRAPAWRALLALCARTDRVIKGQAPGSPWDELLQLTIGLAGRPLFGRPASRPAP
ncbi:DNA-directed DNA polymerase [Thioalkalivibrio sulfidiphilus HL-EbGr7]|uniref:DNA polymerase III subunit delta n=1 Tax=Thioalkalivibrio sulfidiphilus (strain HL-EbGR7) TaxID=396588 RepID=B8GV11_THISH|nr:DNA polymerase III subunit delta [Thioalkalivibrio sulfidiphilus]ACL73357.1 DNA-directed DNA polymerase [Thioalkalivibrio sulfidiphilus HL-EbGr7]